MPVKLSSKPHYFPPLYMGDGLRVEWPVADLVCMKAEGNYTWLFWKTGQRVLSPRTLKYYEPLVAQNTLMRISRNCIVNLNHVLEVECGPMPLVLHLTLGRQESVARRRQKTVWEQIRKHHTHIVNFIFIGHKPTRHLATPTRRGRRAFYDPTLYADRAPDGGNCLPTIHPV